MIVFDNVVKTFDTTKSLNGLSMHVNEGSVYGLVGPNGAGKTTAINHIIGAYKQDSGEVLVLGEPAYENNNVKKFVAHIPDEIFYFSHATGKEMKNFYKGIYPNFSEERYKKLGQALEVDENMQMRKLSRGMQKQVAFRIALSLMPKILVLDEPVDGLDPVMRRQIMSLILEDVAENGLTVLVSSHNLRELEDVCDTVGIMNKGRLMLEHNLSDLQDNIVKVVVSYSEGKEIPESLNVIHSETTGRLSNVIIRGKSSEVEEIIKASAPQFYDIIPLSLEEIFIYELGGEDYAVKDIIL